MVEQALESKTLLVAKNSLEQEYESRRYLFACAFAAEHNLSPHQEPGAQQSGYCLDKDGNYLNHDDGVALKFSVISCHKGKLVWITENQGRESYIIEIKSLTNSTLTRYIFTKPELENLLDKHLHVADRAHALANFRNEVIDLSRDRLIAEYNQLKSKIKGPGEDSLDRSRFNIIEYELSEKLEDLLEEAFHETGQTGRKLYLFLLARSLAAGEISLPLYWISYLCVATGFTFIWKVKELTLDEIEISSKVPPTDADYKDWLAETANLAAFIHNELKSNNSEPAEPTTVHKLVKFAKASKK